MMQWDPIRALELADKLDSDYAWVDEYCGMLRVAVAEVELLVKAVKAAESVLSESRIRGEAACYVNYAIFQDAVAAWRATRGDGYRP